MEFMSYVMFSLTQLSPDPFAVVFATVEAVIQKKFVCDMVTRVSNQQVLAV